MNRLAPESRSPASFLHGLSLGALIGAIIAGSSLWSIRRRRRRRPPAIPGQATWSAISNVAV